MKRISSWYQLPGIWPKEFSPFSSTTKRNGSPKQRQNAIPTNILDLFVICLKLIEPQYVTCKNKKKRKTINANAHSMLERTDSWRSSACSWHKLGSYITPHPSQKEMLEKKSLIPIQIIMRDLHLWIWRIYLLLLGLSPFRLMVRISKETKIIELIPERVAERTEKSSSLIFSFARTDGFENREICWFFCSKKKRKRSHV